MITGTLYNSEGGKVSNGYVIELLDSFGGNAKVGRYREPSLTSGSASSINVKYAPGDVPVGEEVTISLDSILNPDGIRTPVNSNEIKIYIRE